MKHSDWGHLVDYQILGRVDFDKDFFWNLSLRSDYSAIQLGLVLSRVHHVLNGLGITLLKTVNLNQI